MRVARAALVLSVSVWLATIVVGTTTWPQHEIVTRYSHGSLKPISMILYWYSDKAFALGSPPAGSRLLRLVFVGGHVFALFVQAAGAIAAIVALGREPSLRTLRGVALGLVSCILCLVLGFLVLVIFTTGTL